MRLVDARGCDGIGSGCGFGDGRSEAREAVGEAGQGARGVLGGSKLKQICIGERGRTTGRNVRWRRSALGVRASSVRVGIGGKGLLSDGWERAGGRTGGASEWLSEPAAVADEFVGEAGVVGMSRASGKVGDASGTRYRSSSAVEHNEARELGGVGMSNGMRPGTVEAKFCGARSAVVLSTEWVNPPVVVESGVGGTEADGERMEGVRGRLARSYMKRGALAAAGSTGSNAVANESVDCTGVLDPHGSGV